MMVDHVKAKNMSAEDTAAFIHTALQQERQSMPKPNEPGYDQSVALQRVMIRSLGDWARPYAVPLLKEIASSPDNSNLHKNAANALLNATGSTVDQDLKDKAGQAMMDLSKSTKDPVVADMAAYGTAIIALYSRNAELRKQAAELTISTALTSPHEGARATAVGALTDLAVVSSDVELKDKEGKKVNVEANDKETRDKAGKTVLDLLLKESDPKLKKRLTETAMELASYSDNTEIKTRAAEVVISLSTKSEDKQTRLAAQAVMSQLALSSDIEAVRQKASNETMKIATDSQDEVARKRAAETTAKIAATSDSADMRAQAMTTLDKLKGPELEQATKSLLAILGKRDQTSLSAALVLTESGTKGIPTEVQKQARAVIADRLKTLTSEAKELEVKTKDAKEIGKAWAQIEKLYERIDPEGKMRDTYAYNYALMRRMAGELGEKHKDMAPIYNKLADLIEQGNDPTQAAWYRQKAKEAGGDTAGDDKTSQLLRDRFSNVRKRSQAAVEANDAGALEKSEKELKELGKEMEQKLGKSSKDLAAVYTQLGKQYMLQNRPADGEQAYKNAVKIYESGGKDKMPAEAAESLLGLTRFYAGTGNTAGYQEFKGKMLDMSRIAGSKQVTLESTKAIMDLADYLTSDASTQQMAGDAEQLLQTALQRRQAMNATPTTETADAQQALADYYSSFKNPRGDFKKAEQLLKDSMQTYQTTQGGTNNEKWAVSQAKLAHVFASSGRYKEALAGYGAAIDAMHNPTAPVDAAKYREVVNAYAQTLEHTGKAQEAAALRADPRTYRLMQKMKDQTGGGLPNSVPGPP
jgi:hypothetical protein